ncbi:hypothetical protein V8F33_007614 [Rhypophila sp. PSN 637]
MEVSGALYCTDRIYLYLPFMSLPVGILWKHLTRLGSLSFFLSLLFFYSSIPITPLLLLPTCTNRRMDKRMARVYLKRGKRVVVTAVSQPGKSSNCVHVWFLSRSGLGERRFTFALGNFHENRVPRVQEACGSGIGLDEGTIFRLEPKADGLISLPIFEDGMGMSLVCVGLSTFLRYSLCITVVGEV